jgi:hypothetical protein
VVDHVIAVGAASLGLEVGRAVQVCDAKFLEVAGLGGGVTEGEAGVELYAVRAG